MAGDWIKVEHASPDKPEILRLARLWGIDKAAAFGVCVRFWVWLDSATVDGVVDGVASHEVDDVMRFPGFAGAMVAVGWLKVDDEHPRIEVPNFAAHNGQSAKKRALKNRRQAKWRGNSVDASVDARASPEKRKEEKSLKTTTLSGSQANADANRLIREQANDALQRLNRLAGRSYKAVAANLDPIIARLREGHTERDLRVVIATKCNEWRADEKMAEYLRPKTLFNRTNFASYAGQVPPLEAVS